MRLRAVVLALALPLTLAGCGPHHIATFTPRTRDYRPGRYAQRDPANRAGPGSVFSDAVVGYLEDTRAGRVGDILVVRIDEAADARGSSSTNLQRQSNTTIGAPNVLGLMGALRAQYPTLDPSRLLELASRSTFAGDGNTQRNGVLAGQIAVRVTQQMPNGDLYVEGTKVVMINNEEFHLYLSGLVRPVDIAPDDTVPSSRVADAQVEFSGRGDVDEQNRPGWLTRLINAINPF